MAVPSGGAIAAAVARIREITDEPDVQAKYSDARLVSLMNEAWQTVTYDLYAQATNPPLARYTVTPVKDQFHYHLPANVGEVRRVCRRNSDGVMTAEIIPDPSLSVSGPGFRIEGLHSFYLNPPIKDSNADTFDIEYIPSGDTILQTGSVSVSGASTTVLPLASSPTLGEVDRRPYAYLGCYLGIYTGSANPSGYDVFPVQQRIIEDYDIANQTVTVSVAFDFDPSDLGGGETVSYEIYPMEAPIIWPVITREVARLIAGMEGDERRFKMLNALKSEAVRSCALTWANMEGITGNTMDAGTHRNPDMLINHPFYRGWY